MTLAIKKTLIFVSIAITLPVYGKKTIDTGNDKTGSKVSAIESRYDNMPENLPSPLPQEVYTPSFKSTHYRPIMVDYKSATKDTPPVEKWTPIKTRVLSYMVDYTRAVNTQKEYQALVNRYGSCTAQPKQSATGRFHVRKIDGRWWIIDPEGYLHYERGVCAISKGQSERNVRAWNDRFGTDEKWIATTQAELAELGFHGAGAFGGLYHLIQAHNTVHPEAPMTFTPTFSFLSQFRRAAGLQYPGNNSRNECALVIAGNGSQTWEQFCMNYVATAFAPYKNDPNVLGFFSDNELSFAASADNLLQRLLDLNDSSDYGYLYAKTFMEGKGAVTVTDALVSEFLGCIAEKYYKGIKDAITAFDPGMMYLGSRLHGRSKYHENVIRAAGKYCDIVSINYYSHWSPELTTYVKKWDEWADAPFLVTEWYTKGIEDNGLNNETGAGLWVRNETSRAYAYQHFMLGLLEAKNCVGWHWYRYLDSDDKRSVNKGLYDNYYRMYPYLGKFMRDLNYNVYSLIEWFDAQ